MSSTWRLVCVDCRTSLLVGKVANTDIHGRKLPWQFDGFTDWETRDPIEGEELRSVVQHFLILHRGHPLGVVPSHYPEEIDEEGRFIDLALVALVPYLQTEPRAVGVDDEQAVSPRLKSLFASRIAEVSPEDEFEP